MSEDADPIGPSFAYPRLRSEMGCSSESSQCREDVDALDRTRLERSGLSSREIDLAIAAYLKVHQRAPLTEISKAVGVAAQTVARSIERMKESGALRVVAASSLSVDQMERVVVVQFATRGDLDGLSVHISDHPYAMSVYKCTGQFQLIAMFQYGDMRDLEELGAHISQWREPISQISYSFAMETLKFDITG